MDYTVLGVSSGIGVSLFPFKEHCIGNIEPRAIFHTPKNEQWKVNFGNIPLWRDLPENALKPNVIISSPDCGSGSVLRYSRAKKLGNHRLNASLAISLKSIRKYRPDFFYLENLPGLMNSLPQKRWAKTMGSYTLILHTASVSHWGNSQINRKRLVIIGIRHNLVGNWEKIFRLPDRRDKIKTCGELYGDLMKFNLPLGHISEYSTQEIAMYGGCKMPLYEVQRVWASKPRAKRWAVTDRKYKNAPGVYRNRKKDYPATARKSNRQFDHWGRQLSPRQLARIQGVPDSFRLYVEKGLKRNYWINKARAAVTKTPPMEISIWFKQKLDKYYGNR